MWAICRYDYGMDWARFRSLTLAEFEALEERRTINVRYARFNAALITSVLVNKDRSEDSEPIHPFDFLPGMDEDEDDREKAKLRKSVKHSVALTFAEMRGATPEQVQERKQRIIRGLASSGIEDPEELIREVFPDL